MWKYMTAMLALAVLGIVGGQAARAQTYGSPEEAAVAKALKDAKVTLQQGLTASQHEGTPISGKFEMEHEKLQLSVYTMKGKQFTEVIVDYTTGKVTETEAITGGDDLAAAQAQHAAMAKAKKGLRAAVEAAVKANAGSRAVSVIPALKDGHPVSTVTLAKGDAITTVSEKLD